MKYVVTMLVPLFWLSPLAIVMVSHDCVALTFDCDKCGQEGHLVMEYGSYGKRWWLGDYRT